MKASKRDDVWILFFAGWIWHMIYAATGFNDVIGLIAPVNESVWEHLKLGYGATLVLMVRDVWRAVRGQQNTSVLGRAAGIIVMNIAIVVGFYSYEAVIGSSLIVVDIALYGVACWIATLIHERIASRRPSAIFEYVGIALLVMIAFVFAYLTIHVPDVAIFRSNN